MSLVRRISGNIQKKNSILSSVLTVPTTVRYLSQKCWRYSSSNSLLKHIRGVFRLTTEPANLLKSFVLAGKGGPALPRGFIRVGQLGLQDFVFVAVHRPEEQEETEASCSNSSLRTNKASNSNNKVKNKDLPGYSGDAFRYEGIARTFQQHHSAARCVHGLTHRPLPELNLQWIKSPHEGFLDKIAGKLSLAIRRDTNRSSSRHANAEQPTDLDIE